MVVKNDSFRITFDTKRGGDKLVSMQNPWFASNECNAVHLVALQSDNSLRIVSNSVISMRLCEKKWSFLVNEKCIFFYNDNTRTTVSKQNFQNLKVLIWRTSPITATFIWLGSFGIWSVPTSPEEFKWEKKIWFCSLYWEITHSLLAKRKFKKTQSFSEKCINKLVERWKTVAKNNGKIYLTKKCYLESFKIGV